MFINQPTNERSHGARRAPWLTIGLTLLMVGLYLLGQQPLDLMLLDKTAIMQGEHWRFLTGHFVHVNFDHLFWDLLAFVILGAVIEMHKPKHLLPILLVSCLGVSTWMMLGEDNLALYCGLSGALNGLLVLAAMMQWKMTDNKIFLYVMLGTIAKIIYEFATQQTIFTDLASKAVPSAHAAGFVSGFLYLGCLKLKNQMQQSLNQTKLKVVVK